MRLKILFVCFVCVVCVSLFCKSPAENPIKTSISNITQTGLVIDTNLIPKDRFGSAVRYGRDLMMNTAYYLGPNGIKGHYLGNKMNCSNCHQEAGTKPYSFNLINSHAVYPQYRAREGKILTLAERINNCVMRPHNGRPLPLDGEEMIAMLSYLKWINTFTKSGAHFQGEKNMSLEWPTDAADPERGGKLYQTHCSRCHGAEGEGVMDTANTTFTYPPLWGHNSYQNGSSMHRVIKQAQWLKANMPFDKVKPGIPFLSDADALDLAAFINDDKKHQRPDPITFDYPHIEEKAIDYDKAPFADTFSIAQHKFGPYLPIINFWKARGLSAVY